MGVGKIFLGEKGAGLFVFWVGFLCWGLFWVLFVLGLARFLCCLA